MIVQVGIRILADQDTGPGHARPRGIGLLEPDIAMRAYQGGAADILDRSVLEAAKGRDVVDAGRFVDVGNLNPGSTLAASARWPIGRALDLDITKAHRAAKADPPTISVGLSRAG